jgi:TorA maturation chaperone TorD
MSAQKSTLTASNQKQATRPLARSEVYLFLARGFAYPRFSLDELFSRAQLAAAILGDDAFAIVDQLEIPLPADMETQYIGTFGHTMKQSYPAYEMEYDQGHVFMQSQSMAELASFYRTFGAQAASGERLDHVATELEFMYFLTYKEAHAVTSDTEKGAEVCSDGQRRFLEKHLGRWAPPFLGGLMRGAEGFYRPLAKAARSWLDMEIKELGAHPRALGEDALPDTSSPSLFDFGEDLSPCGECEEVRQ